MTTRSQQAAGVRRQLDELVRRDGQDCHYCGKPCPVGTRSRDHVVPQALFGPDDLDNLVLAHYWCNGERGDKIDKCWCSFCRKANERWLNKGLQMLATVRRTDEERAAMFRKVWTRTDKGVER